MGAVIIPFSGQFTNNVTGEVVTGKRLVMVQIVSGNLTSGVVPLWTEYFDYTFVSGNLVTELGRVTPLDETIFLGRDLRFLFQVEGIPGVVMIPILPQPIGVVALMSLEAQQVSASAITGIMPSALLSGAYPGITAVGTLNALTVGDRALVIQGLSNRVGIGVSDPGVSLEVSGSIKLRAGGITFPDGTVLSSAPLDTMIAKQVSSNDEVLIDADTSGRGFGDIRFRTRGVDRVTITNAGRMGIGVTNPTQLLEVAGGIKIGPTVLAAPGTMRYMNGSFEGFDGTQWKALDVQANSDGIWESDTTAGVVRLKSPSLKVGIGIQNPQYPLDVSGTVKATQFEGVFKGDGSGLTGIGMTQLTGVLPIASGGTGTANFSSPGVVVYQPASDALTTLALGRGQFPMGDGTGGVVARGITAGPGIQVVLTPTGYLIDHAASPVVPIGTSQAPGVMVTGVALDTYGHVTRLVTANLDERYYTQASANARFLSTEGGIINGSLYFESGASIGGTDVLQFAPSADTKVGIGMANPQQKLDIAGGIRIGNTAVAEPGSIRFTGTQFEGYAGGSWRVLDQVVNSDSGWTLSGTTIVSAGIQRVGIATLNPVATLAVSGSVMVSEGVWVGQSLTVNERIQLGEYLITPGVWSGSWSVPDGAVSANRWRVGDVSGLDSNERVLVGGTLQVTDGVRVGALGISANGTITGPWSFATVTTNTVKGVGGLTVIPNGTLQIGDVMTLDGNTLSALSPTFKWVVSANQMVSISSTLNAGGLVVGSVVTVDARIGGVGINANPMEGVSLVVNGDVVIGKYQTLPVGGGADTSDLYVEGNLIVGGSLINNGTTLSLLDVPYGGSMATSPGSRVAIGSILDSQRAKLNVRGDRDLSQDVVDVRGKTGTVLLRVKESGYVGVGLDEPAAFLHVRAGTASVPAFRLTEGPLLTTPMPGAFEFSSGKLYVTLSDGIRYEVGLSDASQVMTDKTFVNTTLQSVTLNNVSMTGTTVMATGSRVAVSDGATLWIDLGVGGKMGIGESNPQATLDVAGPIRVGTYAGSTPTEGIVEYRNNRFYGYTNNGWVALDNSQSEGAVQFTDATRTAAYSLAKLGVKTMTPATELEVVGTVSASYVVGDGSGLSGLTWSQVQGVLPVSQGGTGLSVVPAQSVLIGGGEGASLQTLSLAPGQLLMGGSQGMVGGRIVAGGGIRVTTSDGQIEIALSGSTPLPNTITFDNGSVPEMITLDTYGRLVGLTTKSLDDRYILKSDANNQYLSTEGGTLRGTLTIDVDGMDLVGSGGAFTIMPGGTGKVGIGTTTPRAMLDVAGAIRVASTDISVVLPVNRPGTIQYHNGRFQGYNDTGWVNLDVGDTVQGTFTAAMFRGDGSQITNINPLNFSSPLPVSKGGTGVATFPVNSVLIGNADNPLRGIALSDGQILMGSDQGPTGSVLVGQGITIRSVPGQLRIEHPARNAAVPAVTTLANGDVLQSIGVDAYGHIDSIRTRNMDLRYYTKDEVDTLLRREGDIRITGTLIFDIPLSKPAITTQTDQHLLINPAGQGSIVMGVDRLNEVQPRAFVSIGGDGYGRSGEAGGVQLMVGGAPNTGVNQTGTKVLISNYSGFSGTVYPIMAQDDAGNIDFYVRNRNGVSRPTQTFIAGQLFVGVPTSDSMAAGTVKAQYFVGDGSQLRNIQLADAIGIIPVSLGGTGLSELTRGGVLLGNGRDNLVATRVFGAGELIIGTGDGMPTLGRIQGTPGHIEVTNLSGAITLSLPQPIDQAASPTFASVTAIEGVRFNGTSSRWQGPEGSSMLVVLSKGNIGLGVENPTTFLDVSGNMRVSDALRVGGKMTVGETLQANQLVVAGGVSVANGSFEIKPDTQQVLIGTDGVPVAIDIRGSLGISGTLNATTVTVSGLTVMGNASVNELQVVSLDVSQQLVFPSSLVIDSMGRVGINTTAPSQTLDINGNLVVSGSATVDGLSVKNNARLGWGSGGGLLIDAPNQRVGINTLLPEYELDVSGDIRISRGMMAQTMEIAQALRVGDNDNRTLVVEPTTHRVGINTAAPAAALDVVGDAKVSTQLNAGSIQVAGDIDVNTTTLVVKAGMGRVGIGTANPEVALDVVGDVNVNGDMRLGNVMTVKSILKRVGINEPNPKATLDVNGSLAIANSLTTGELFVTRSLRIQGDTTTPLLQVEAQKVGVNVITPLDTLHVGGGLLVNGTLRSNQLAVTGDVWVRNAQGLTILKVDTATQRVGINQDNPSVELDVSGNVTVAGTLQVTTLRVSDNVEYVNPVTSQSIFKVDALNSRVGILTNTPLVALDVRGNTGVSAVLKARDIVSQQTLQVGSVFWVDGSNNRIGINTLSPQATVDVVGNWRLSGQLNQTGSLRVTGDVRVMGSNSTPVLQVMANSAQVGINTPPVGNNALSVAGNADVSGTISAVHVSANVLTVSQNLLVAKTISGGIRRVGIQTGDPQTTLDVSGNMRVSQTMTAQDVELKGNLTVANSVLVVDAATQRVGINRSNPELALDVGGSVRLDGALAVNSLAVTTSVRVGTLLNPVVWVDGSTQRMGVNTASPEASLHVVGNVKMTGDVAVGGAVRVSGNATLMAPDGTKQSYIGVAPPQVGIGIPAGALPQAELDVRGDVWVSGTVTANRLVGNGAGITNLSVTQFGGVVPVSHGGTGLSTPPLDGQILIGQPNGTYALGQIAVDTSQLTLVIEDNQIKLGLRYPIDPSVSPTFTSLTLTGPLTFKGTTGIIQVEDNLPLRILLNGNSKIGINTLTPEYTLDVNGTGRFTDDLRVGNAGVVLLASGRMAIGKLQPDVALDVVGTANISRDLWVGNNVTINGELRIEKGVAPPLLSVKQVAGQPRVGIGVGDAGAALDVRGDVYVAGSITANRFEVNTLSVDTISIQEGVSLGGLFILDAINQKIGIGTTEPQVALDVRGGGDISEGLRVNGTTLVVDHVNQRVGIRKEPTVTLDVMGDAQIKGHLRANALSVTGNVSIGEGGNGTPVLWVDATNQRVGVNTANPSVAFEVVGSMKVTGRVTAPSFAGIGSDLTNLNASAVSLGVLPVSRGGTGRGQTDMMNDDNRHKVLVVTGEESLGLYAITSNQMVVDVTDQNTFRVTLPQPLDTDARPTFNALTINSTLYLEGTNPFVITANVPLHIDTSGGVGIGKVAEAGKMLTVKGNSIFDGRLQVGDGIVLDGPTQRVGIGLLTPAHALHVSGNVKMDGPLLVNGVVTINQRLVVGTNTLWVDADNQWVGIGTANRTNATTQLDIKGNVMVSGSMTLDSVTVNQSTVLTSLQVTDVIDRTDSTYRLSPGGNSRLNTLVANRLETSAGGYVIDPANISSLNRLVLSRWIDRDDASYGIDPSGSSTLNILTVDRLQLPNGVFFDGTQGNFTLDALTVRRMSDRDDNRYAWDGNGTATLNELVVNELRINDNPIPAGFLTPQQNAGKWVFNGDAKWKHWWVGTLLSDSIVANHLHLISSFTLGRNHQLKLNQNNQVLFTYVDQSAERTVTLNQTALNALYISQRAGVTVSDFVRQVSTNQSMLVDLNDATYQLDLNGTSRLNTLIVDKLTDASNVNFVIDPSDTTRVNALTVDTISKTSGSFDIPHPDPSKAADGIRLRHYFVETPSAGGNLYKYQVYLNEGENSVPLPDYFDALNQDALVWVTPFQHFGRGWGVVKQNDCVVTVNKSGWYNLLVFGDRKDPGAKANFDAYGVEYRMESGRVEKIR